MYKNILIFSLLILVTQHHVQACKNPDESCYKEGDQVHFCLKEGVMAKAAVLGTYEQVHGKTIIEENGSDFALYVQNVLPEDELPKFLRTISSPKEVKDLDEYAIDLLLKSNLVQTSHVYVVQPEKDKFPCVVHASQLTKIQETA